MHSMVSSLNAYFVCSQLRFRVLREAHICKNIIRASIYPYTSTVLHVQWETMDERNLTTIPISQGRTSWIQTILTDKYLTCFYQSTAAAEFPSAMHSSLPSLPNQISPYFSLNLVLCRWLLPTKCWHSPFHLFLKFCKCLWSSCPGPWVAHSSVIPCSFIFALPEAVSLKPVIKGLMNFFILLRCSAEVMRFGHIPSSRERIRISFLCFI